ncbi:sensor histidine kinase [Cognatilysobacter tabacisoli]|uniref:sensor histidine kinase n=1 Tax=Cognatilysobacter tabacisoli TaxID=2315424 RepID=UPI0018C8A95D|nr:sensor histidine kinase [Lysobacter tabacisoli]
MNSGLADFIEHHSESIIEQAIEFARTVEVGTPMDQIALRDHLPEIIAAIVADLRTPQSRAEEIEKSEGRAAPNGRARSAAAVHALHRAHSGYSISDLVAEYRALRASVLRLWADAPDPASLRDLTRFNEAIDEAIAESVTHYADEVARWRDIFLGVLGHDLRSPLGAVVMTAQLIAQMAADTPVAVEADRLVRISGRMLALLDRLLVYNRAQMGLDFEVDAADVDLAQACREEVELLQAALPGRGIAFASPATVRGRFDAGRVREALANLVVNAHKYGTRSGEIRVDLRDDGGHAALCVSNDGEPIPRETLDLMFEPLRRGGVADADSEHASLGLGLFIVSQIAQAHGGTIRAESDGGVTTFCLQLPRGCPAAA